VTSLKTVSGGISRPRISPILVRKGKKKNILPAFCNPATSYFRYVDCVCNALASIRYSFLIELYIVPDDRDRRRGSHLLLEGEFTESPDVHIKLRMIPIYTLNCLLTT
jgi:hypothetical protein